MSAPYCHQGRPSLPAFSRRTQSHSSAAHPCTLLLQLVRRIDVTVRDVRWSDSGELVAVLAESSFYILRYDSGAVEQAREEGTANEEDGIEEAFELLSEVTERVRTGESLFCCLVCRVLSKATEFCGLHLSRFLVSSRLKVRLEGAGVEQMRDW